MKHFLATTLLLSSALVLFGCGGGSQAGGTLPTPQPLFFDTTGNWQFTTTSTAGNLSLSIAGSIDQSVSAVTATVHVDGSNCFDPLTAIALTGKLASTQISFTSTAVNGQVITLVGDISATSFAGTFAIEGGCAAGGHGDLKGAKVPSITSHLNGTFATSGGNATFNVTAQVTQGSASPAGTYDITGTAAFGPSCFKSGTITSATFPSGSFILGTAVALEIATDNGILSFHGIVNQATGEITGDYVISNGTCSQTGTAVFVATGQWDY